MNNIDIWLFLQTNWRRLKLTSTIKSVKGLRLSGSSWLLWSSRLYFTRNRARFFSSLDTFSRMSIFSTSSGQWKRAARMVMGLGERSLAFCHTRFISSTLPSGGKPEEEQGQEGWATETEQDKNRNTNIGYDYNSFDWDSADNIPKYWYAGGSFLQLLNNLRTIK